MKFDLDNNFATGALARSYSVRGETDRLTDVLLCVPDHLSAVPCCAVTRASIQNGFVVSTDAASAQHDALRTALQAAGVRCHAVHALSDLPDMCFTRDSAVMTPWGLLGLKPALPHREREVDHVMRYAERKRVPVLGRIELGTVEGGDICIARPGLAIIGVSGERTDEQGAEGVATLFRAEGWDVHLHRFDPHFLHFDTQFCMLTPDLALACEDVLPDAFLAQIRAWGIRTIAVGYKEAQQLCANVLALGGGRILASDGSPRVVAAMRKAGLDVTTVDVSQFTHCGGGIHCLTMPLARAA